MGIDAMGDGFHGKPNLSGLSDRLIRVGGDAVEW
jgi:hypothetical protein